MQIFLYFKTKFFEWREQKFVTKQFYSHQVYKQLDQKLLSYYRIQNPYHLSKDYLLQKGASQIYAYGETPLTTMAKIVKECQLNDTDVVVELGCGRGRAALFLAGYVGCKVQAYEQIRAFLEGIPKIANLTLFHQDMLTADFSTATAIFLYGTMLEEEEIKALVCKFPPKIKIITVSYPLSDYSDKYRVIKTFSGVFPWGETEVYWNERTC